MRAVYTAIATLTATNSTRAMTMAARLLPVAIGKAIKSKLLYFKFIYPWQLLLIILVVMLIICFMFSSVIYLKNRNLTDELRRADD